MPTDRDARALDGERHEVHSEVDDENKFQHPASRRTPARQRAAAAVAAEIDCFMTMERRGKTKPARVPFEFIRVRRSRETGGAAADEFSACVS